MTDICERLVVHCPDHEASRYLAAFVADHRSEDGTVRITLRLPISASADRRPLTERPVVATLYPLESIGDLHPTYSVTWLPKGDGPSPEFAGALAVTTSPRADCFGLILSGHYQQGAAGTSRVDKRGRRIARVSAREVLRTIADHVEKARAHNEAALAGHSALAHMPLS